MLGGASREAVEKRKGQLLFALLADAERVADGSFKLQVAETLIANRKLRGDGLDRDGVLLLVESMAGLRPRSHVWALVESLQLLEETDGRYRLRSRIILNDFRRTGERSLPRSLQDVGWTLEEMAALFFPVERLPWTVRTVREAATKGYRWLLWTLKHTLDNPSGESPLPAFWNCSAEGDTPVGMLRAVTSVGDTLGALVDSGLSDWSRTLLTPADGPLVGFAVRQLLTYVGDPPAPPGHHDHGGFLPHDDQPEALHPTVDATWDAVLALSSVYDAHDGLVERMGPPETPREDVGAALRDGVAFLLRMQLPNGAWGIYRFPDDVPEVPAYEFTTAQTILALRLALLSGACGEELAAAVEAGSRRAWEFLRARAVEIDGCPVWLPYFGTSPEDVDPRDALRTTVWIATGLIALRGAFADLRSELDPYLRGVVAWADRHWRPDYKRIAEVEFRVPLEDKLNDTYGKWSNRYDVTVVIPLLTLFNESRAEGGPDVSLSSNLWERIESTIGNILKEQHPDHGHWNEPTEGLPLAAATAMAIQALQAYLVAARHLTLCPVVAPTEV